MIKMVRVGDGTELTIRDDQIFIVDNQPYGALIDNTLYLLKHFDKTEWERDVKRWCRENMYDMAIAQYRPAEWFNQLIQIADLSLLEW